jgi:hypothetical protein
MSHVATIELEIRDLEALKAACRVLGLEFVAGQLGPQVQVLHFGVDGYGVDQAYLRYQRDVRPWHPDLVILGFINHDLHRSLAVYSFVSFPSLDNS